MYTGLFILGACALLFSSALFYTRRKRNWRHAFLVGLASYLIMQVGNTIYLGHIDPSLFVGFPYAVVPCMAVYYIVFFIGSLFAKGRKVP